MNILLNYHTHLSKYLTPSQQSTLKILTWLLQVYKLVTIEKLSASFPLPILYESRRKHIQRFLKIANLSITNFWLPMIYLIITKEFFFKKSLILTIDRTQWQNNNILMVAAICKKRAIPVYWTLLDKRGSSNLLEQIIVLRPVLKQFKTYELTILGDREFHSIKLAYWLQQRHKKASKSIYFAFRQKKDTYIKSKKQKEIQFKNLEVIPGVKQFFTDLKITKEKGFGKFNAAVYLKRKYKNNMIKEPWYIVTNLTTLEEVILAYQARTGIEAMFKDCKTGGYNLEKTKAKKERLISLILLIAIAYTNSVLKGRQIKNQGLQKYIARLKDKKRSIRRHSDFWVGLYGDTWIISWEYCWYEVEKLMAYHRDKFIFYQRGLKAMSFIQAL